MKKIFIFSLVLTLFPFYSQSFWYFDVYEQELVDAFINSVNGNEYEAIEWDRNRYCEQVYLEANRRRDFTYEELELCRDIFSIKHEEEINYMRYVLWERWIYY
jgi:hypothetical protein